MKENKPRVSQVYNKKIELDIFIIKIIEARFE